MDTQVEEFVKNPYLAVLSTVSPSGAPQATVTWYIYEEGVFWFNAGGASQKARNIRRHPEVSLTVDERSWPYKGVTVYGRAEEAAFDEEQARRMAVRYVGESEGGAMHRAMMAGEQRVRIRIVPDRVAQWDFSGWDYKRQAS